MKAISSSLGSCYPRKIYEPSRKSLSEWLPGLVLGGKGLQCLFDCSVYLFSGTNGPGNECSRERIVPRTKVPSWERMFQGTNSLENEYSSIPFFHTLDESSSYWRTICGLELFFIVFVFNNQCFNFIYCVWITSKKCVKFACNYFSCVAECFFHSVIRWYYFRIRYFESEIQILTLLIK